MRRNAVFRKLPEKIKKKKVKFRKTYPIRRVFKTTKTEQSRQFVVRKIINRGKKRFFFRADRGGIAETVRVFIVQTIFSRLYPQYSIRPIGIGYEYVDGKLVAGMYSPIISRRSRTYKEHQRAVYSFNQNFEGPHTNFTRREAWPVQERIEIESGMRVNAQPVNVAEADNKPIFFEIAWLNPRHLNLKLKREGITHGEVRGWFANLPPICRKPAEKMLNELFSDSEKLIDFNPKGRGDTKEG